MEDPETVPALAADLENCPEGDCSSIVATVNFPSLWALFTLFSETCDHVVRISCRWVAEEMPEGEVYQDSFKLVKPIAQEFDASQQTPSHPSCLPSLPAPPAAKLGLAAESSLLSTLKCDGAEWGMRHCVRYIGRHHNQPHDTEASFTPEKQCPATQDVLKSKRNCKRKREAEESSNDKHRYEKKNDKKNQGSGKKSLKKEKKRTLESKGGDPRHGKDRCPATQEVRKSKRNCKRKREAEQSSRDKHRDEGNKDIKNQGGSKKVKKRTKESKGGDPHHGKDRWSAECYAAAERSLLDIMRSQDACFCAPVLYKVLRKEARKHIDDTGLLDHLLKHMAGQVPEGSAHRFCRRRRADGAMEYWLELAEHAGIRQQAGVSDPYWVPLPGWKPGDDMSLVDSDLLVKRLVEITEDIDALERQLEQLLCEDDGEFNAERAYSSLKNKCQIAMSVIEKIEKKMLCLKDMCENMVQMNGELKMTFFKEKYQSAVRAHEKLEKTLPNWKEFCKSVIAMRGEQNEDIYEASVNRFDMYDGPPIFNVVTWDLEGSKVSVCRGYEGAIGHFRLWNFTYGQLLNLEPWLGPNKAIYTTALKGTFYCTMTFEKHWVILPIDGRASWDHGFINRYGIWEFPPDNVKKDNSDLRDKHEEVKNSYLGGQSKWSNWSMLHGCSGSYSIKGLCPKSHGALKFSLESVRSSCITLSDYKGEMPVPKEVRESCAILISYFCEGSKFDFAFDIHRSSLLEFDPELGALSPAKVIKCTSPLFNLFKCLPQFNVPRCPLPDPDAMRCPLPQLGAPPLQLFKSQSIGFYVKVEDIKPDFSKLVRKWSALGECKLLYCIRKILDPDDEIPTELQEDVMSAVAMIPVNKVPLLFSSNERTWKASGVDVGANPFNAPAHPLSVEFARPWPFNRKLATNRSESRVMQGKKMGEHLKAQKSVGPAIRGILKAIRLM